MEWFYSIYGLGVSANSPISGLGATTPTGPADVEVVLGQLPERWASGLCPGSVLYHESSNLDTSGLPILRVYKSAQTSCFFFQYCDDTRFVIDHCGCKVWVSWPGDLTVDDAVTYLLGPVLGFVLRLRGLTCLHASAVTVDGKAIALLGTNGSGKSTIAAKFAELGYSVLSDDLIPLREQGDQVLAEPGYPDYGSGRSPCMNSSDPLKIYRS